MADISARFALPFIQPGQAQKEVFHNEALARIDAALHPVVEAMDIATPPASAGIGAAWIVAAAADGDWAGHEGEIAFHTPGGWRFLVPVAGVTAWLRPAAAWIWHDGVAWRTQPLPTWGIAVAGEQVVGARRGAIATPFGGTLIDEEARTAIASILAALREHGLIAA